MKTKLLLSFFAMLVLVTACVQPSATPAAVTATFLPTPVPTHTFTPTPAPTPTSTPVPAWYNQIEGAYSNLEYRYGLVEDPRTKIFTTLGDAAAGNGNFGFAANAPVYFYFYAEETVDGKTWLATQLGWVSADQVRLVTPSSLRGILLTRPVDFRFGWVLQETQSVNAAGVPIRTFTRYEIVHGANPATSNPGFFAVGPDEWLSLDVLAITSSPLPADAPPGLCRFIHVDLSAQVLRVYDACQLVFAALVSTGSDPRWTYPGQYSILNKWEYSRLTQPEGAISVYTLEGVPFFMPYAGDWGLHAAYWHDEFGAPVSHGCVNLSPGDAHWVYEWAVLGDWVIISRP